MTDQFQKIDRLKTRPFTEVVELPVNGERVTNPRISSQGMYLAVNRRDPHDHEEIVVYDLQTLNVISRVRRMPSDHNMSWSPDGAKLYFTQAVKKDSYNFYQDIYALNIDTQAVERVTNDLRTKDIDVSSDGSRIVFVKTEAGIQNLAVLNPGKK